MNPIGHLSRILAPVGAALLAFPTLGAVTSYDIYKIQYWEQNSALEPNLDSFRVVPRAFVEADSDYTSGTLLRPGGLPDVTLQLDTTTFASPTWLSDTTFATEFDMNIAYPDGGEYVFSLNTGSGPIDNHSLPFPDGGIFPDAIPAFSESTRDALLAGPSVDADLELGFNAFSDLTNGDLGVSSWFEVRIYTTQGAQLAYETGLQALGVNSILVPAGTLSSGSSYFAQISFLNSDRFPDGGGTPSGFATYNITTTQDFQTAVPEPRSIAATVGLILLGWRIGLRFCRRS